MRNFIVVACVLFLLHLIANDVLARPDQMKAMTTEKPEQSAAMTTNMTDGSDEDDSSTESGEEETDDHESAEDDKINIDSKTAFTCPSRPTEITDHEAHCMAEYKAMKRAKCNMTAADRWKLSIARWQKLSSFSINRQQRNGQHVQMTEQEEKMKKMNTMESMEGGSHMGKREAPMGDEAEATTNTTKMGNMRHRKRSCHYYQCILKKLDVLDEATMLPHEEMFKTWVTNNVTDDGEKTRLLERVAECFHELRDAGFFVTDGSKSDEVSGEAPNAKKGKTSCNAALKLLKCLSKQDTECPAFKFP